MTSRRRIASWFSLLFLMAIGQGFVTSCATHPPPTTPPESYKGPLAERPILQQGNYWLYQRGNTTKAKTTALVGNLGFPLWIGKRWSYETEMVHTGLPSSVKTNRMPAQWDCQVAGFESVTVAAGTFQAFECRCGCTHLMPGYEPGCGLQTIWYAPEVRNIIQIKTGSTESSMELIEYRASRPAPDKMAPPRKVP